MTANITSSSVNGSSVTLGGTATAGATVGVFVDGVLSQTFATADGSGNWSMVLSGMSPGNHLLSAADMVTGSVSATTQFSGASVTIGSPTGGTTQDTTPQISGTFVNPNGGNVSGLQTDVYYKLSASPTWILDGSTYTDSGGVATYDIKTVLPDGLYDFKMQVNTVVVISAPASVTVSKPDEAPVLADASSKAYADSFDNVLIPVNPANGYVVFDAKTLNIAKPTETYAISGETLGLSINSTTGVCTVSDPTQFTAAGQRSITLTASNVAGSSPTTFNVKIVAVSSTIKYYDSVAGNNANVGDLPGAEKATLAAVGATLKRLKRGASFAEIMSTIDNQQREDYGDPFADRPKIGVGQTHGLNGSDLDNAVLRGLEAKDTTARGFLFQVYSNCLVEDCKVSSPALSNTAAFKFHNSNAGLRPPALTVPDLPGRLFGLIFRRNETELTHGDGLYVTASKGVLVENCKFDGAVGGGADCIQIAYENTASNKSKEVLIRGNMLLQRPELQSDKGALVCEATEGYIVEYNYIGGKNFAFSNIGIDALVRSNVAQYGRLDPKYSWGIGTGEQLHLGRHKVYDNYVNDCYYGFRFSSFGDSTIEYNGVYGYQRYDMDIHDNVINKCGVAFFADRPWSGKVKRNIFMQCNSGIVRQGNATVSGLTVANMGVETTQDITGNFTNDGTFLNTVPPVLSGSINAGATLSVTNGTWSTTPDEIQYFWRDKNGADFASGNGASSFVVPGDAAADFEVSCVVLARKGTNYMLAIAENVWPSSAYFIPRAWQENLLPWRKRYFKLGDVAA